MKEWHSTKSPDYLSAIKIRLLSSIEKRGDCLIWTGKERSGGYGRMRVAGKLTLVHRLTYELFMGPIPSGMDVLHVCDQPLCVSVGHLFVGDHSDNMADKARKGRAPSKLTAAQARIIKRRLAKGERPSHIARDYPVSVNAIFDIRNGVTWRHVTT